MKQCLGMIAVAALGAFGGELVVEPGGLTPHDALAKVRAAKAAGDTGAWTIRVKAGFYALKDMLVFTPADSGTPAAPVTWLGEGEKTVFAGGERLEGWRDMGGGVWSAPVPRAPDGTPVYFEQLWVNGRRADRARLPNRCSNDLRSEYFNVTRPCCVAVSNAAGKVTHAIERVTLTNEAARALAAIPADELPHAQMLVVHKWSFARRILRGVDPATLTVETHGRNPQLRWQNWNARETLVCFENVRAAFDAPGEWFYDVKAGAVLYRPLPGEDMARAEVVVREGPLVGRGVRGVGGIWACNLWYDFSGRPPEFDGLDWEKWRTCGKETGGSYADPLFVNAAANDFRLTSGSPAFALGFEAWDYSAAGPQRQWRGVDAAGR